MENEKKAPKSSKSLIESFHHAINGFLHSFKMERNMKIHVTAAVLVVVAALLTQVTRFELIALSLSIAFVIFAELFNTAVEATVDIAVKNEYSELARRAKDVSASAVLVAAINSVIVGYLIFFRKIYNLSYYAVAFFSENAAAYVVFACLLMVFIAVIAIKSRFIKRGGNYVQGGMPSGHTAFAFCLFTAIAFITEDPVATTFAAIMALIVAESRMETKVHTLAEVLVGALLGIAITIIMFKGIELLIFAPA
ncbi:MAG: diacylglycerol kinase [Christensenellaceae bacterium]|jgi:diacylglycerol kinase (ATP)